MLNIVLDRPSRSFGVRHDEKIFIQLLNMGFEPYITKVCQDVCEFGEDNVEVLLANTFIMCKARAKCI